MARYGTSPQAPGWLVTSVVGLAVSVVVLYTWVYYATGRVDEFSALVYGTHEDDNRQDVQINADKQAVAAHRARLDDLTARVGRIAQEQQYLREANRNLIKSMGLINERMGNLRRRGDRILDAIRAAKDAEPNLILPMDLNDLEPASPDPPNHQ